MTSKPTYVLSKMFSENLVAVHKSKEALTLNKPTHIAMSILDLNKTLMNDFHYNHIKQKQGDKAKLLFTDSESLTYEIETTDAYEDFWKDKKRFDTVITKRIVRFTRKQIKKGLLEIKEFIGLRVKCTHISKTTTKIIKQ